MYLGGILSQAGWHFWMWQFWVSLIPMILLVIWSKDKGE